MKQVEDDLGLTITEGSNSSSLDSRPPSRKCREIVGGRPCPNWALTGAERCISHAGKVDWGVAARLYLFTLRGTDYDRSALVKHIYLERACIVLAEKTSIPAVVVRDVDWVEYAPGMYRHDHDEDLPSLYWEWLAEFRHKGELRGLPGHMVGLTPPRDYADVSVGKPKPRQRYFVEDIGLIGYEVVRTIPSGSTDAKCKINGQEVSPEYMSYRFLSGYQQAQEIKVGEIARLEVSEGSKLPRRGKILEVVVQGKDHKYIVFGKVEGFEVLLKAIEIQRESLP